jgi:hypothetical protein
MKNLLLSLLLLLFACGYEQTPDNNEPSDENRKEVMELTDSLSKAETKIDSLQKENQTHLAVIQYLNSNVSLENKDLCDHFLKETLDIEWLAERNQSGQSSGKFIINRLWCLDVCFSGEDSLKNSKSMFLYNFIQKNREADVIEALYKRNKKFALAILTKPVYVSSGGQNIVKSLIYAYEDLQGKDLNELYIKATKERPTYETYKNLISSRVINLLPKNEELRNPYHDVLWCYSFWVRRYSEKNSAVVYKILKDLDNSIK